jgi:zinc protease
VVTPEQISSTVKKYLFAPNVTITALVPEGEAEELRMESLAALISSYGTVSKPPSTEGKSSQKVITQTLSNGIRVILAPDDSNPVVSFRIVHLGGKRFENRENEGIMNFIAQMINKGAGKTAEVEISRKVEDMGGRLAGFSGYDSFGLSASFFSRHLDEGLNLLATLHSDPTFPVEEFEREKGLIINRIRTEPDRPVSFAENTFQEQSLRVQQRRDPVNGIRIYA